MKHLSITALLTAIVLTACGNKSEAPSVTSEPVKATETVKKEFSCEKSKTEIDAELQKQTSGDVNEPEYWELRQMEYNEKCQKIYDVE